MVQDNLQWYVVFDNFGFTDNEMHTFEITEMVDGNKEKPTFALSINKNGKNFKKSALIIE